MAILPEAPAAPDHGLFSPTELEGHSSRTLHAYVHIPFCSVRCGYCDFNTYTAGELGNLRQSDYAKSLISEIAFSAEVLKQSNAQQRNFETVFFGGGTPSLLPAVDLISMLQSLKNQFGIAHSAEITLEANPDTVTEAKLEQLYAAGFNRISIGMQSADEAVLKTLDRTHNPTNVSLAVAKARAIGFQVSLDLIYGAAGESLDSWRGSLQSAIELEPDHISAYSLIVEPGTKLARLVATGQLSAPDEDLQADKYELADNLLTAAGYLWYEISNWSKDQASQSKHNLAYWLGQDWWGFGPGAHSHIGNVRFWNLKHPASWAKRLEQFLSPALGRELLNVDQYALERILLESRLARGLELATLEQLTENSPANLAQLLAEGLVDGEQLQNGILRLTLSGRLLADQVVRTLSS